MAGCDFGWVAPTVGGHCVGNGTGATAKDLGGSAFDDIAESAAQAASTTVKALGSAWMDLGVPDLADDSGPVAFLRGSTLWFTSFTAVLCLLIAAGQLAWQRRGEPARQALQGLLNLVVVSSAGVAAVNLLAVASDKFSVWIIDRSTGCRQISATGIPVESCLAEFDERTSAMLALGGTDSSFLVLIMAILVTVSSLGQIALMIARIAVLVILTGTLPLSAAASSTAGGRTWFRKSVSWLLAFVLYKPAAAVVYAAAFAMTGRRQDNEVVSMVSGVVLIVLACFTLPALLRFASPVVQAATSGAGRVARPSEGAGGQTAVTGALPVPHLRNLAAGRSVSGAAVGREVPGGAGAGGASRPVPVPARGAEGARGVPDAERALGGQARPTDTGRTHPQEWEDPASPVPVPDHDSDDAQLEKPRGRQ
ncbi:type IV secretion system protein TrbL [Streptomyces sp. SAI-163]